jgi:hypothetical protein
LLIGPYPSISNPHRVDFECRQNSREKEEEEEEETDLNEFRSGSVGEDDIEQY